MGQITTTIEDFLRNSGAMEFFQREPGRRVFREQDLCARSGRLFRADRVVIDGDQAVVVDFKTGGDEREEDYVQQLKNYMALVAEAFRVRAVRGVVAYVDRQRMCTV